MGREWLYKTAISGSGGGGSRGGGGGGGGGGTSPSTRPSVSKKTKRERNTSSSSSSTSGCMTAFFKLFDIQNHQFRFHHPSFMSESAINNNPQGVEAPRNSLQSLESVVEVTPPPRSSTSSEKLERSNLNIPMGGMQIKTKRTRLTEVDLSSECSSSPSTKTPNLVARLMGLDLLPEYSSPRPSSSSTPATTTHHHRTRSLPTTPRTSTASRRSTDNDYHHRLSLQIDKENCNPTYTGGQQRRRSELSVNRQDHDERSKQIANQVRERISRRLGTDITNTIRNNDQRRDSNLEQRRDSNLVMLKPKKQQPVLAAPAPVVVKTKRDDSVTFSSSSPKLRLLDMTNNLNRTISYSQQPKQQLAKSASFSASVRNSTHDQNQAPMAKKCKRIESERYDLRLKKEVLVNKINSSNKKKSTPLHNHVVNVTNNTTKLLSFKKEMTSSSSTSSYDSTTRLPQKKVSLLSMTQLPSNSSLNNSSYNSNDTRTLNLFSVKDSTSSSTTTNRRFSDHFEVLEDIDRLISIDMGRSMRRLMAAEAEEIATEIEGEIMERMVDEMAMEMAGWV